MKKYRVEESARARDQARQIARWWRANRPAARTQFVDELDAAFQRLSTFPSSGAPYRAKTKEMRRVLLRGCGYHVYYTVHEVPARVLVRAVWHAARGRGPRLK